jgi:hypothetical protein
VPQRVVDRLEVVEVEQEHGDLGLVLARAGQRVRDAVAEEGAVREAGQRVVQRLPRQLRLEALALRDVAGDPLHADDRAVALRDPRPHLERHDAAVRAQHGDLEVALVAREEALDGVALRVGQNPLHAAADELVRAAAEHPLPGGVDGDEAPVGVEAEDDVVRALEQLAEARLALAQRVLGDAPLGHVARDHEPPDHAPGAVAERGGGDVEDDARPVAVPHDLGPPRLAAHGHEVGGPAGERGREAGLVLGQETPRRGVPLDHAAAVVEHDHGVAHVDDHPLARHRDEAEEDVERAEAEEAVGDGRRAHAERERRQVDVATGPAPEHVDDVAGDRRSRDDGEHRERAARPRGRRHRSVREQRERGEDEQVRPSHVGGEGRPVRDDEVVRRRRRHGHVPPQEVVDVVRPGDRHDGERRHREEREAARSEARPAPRRAADGHEQRRRHAGDAEVLDLRPQELRVERRRGELAGVGERPDARRAEQDEERARPRHAASSVRDHGEGRAVAADEAEQDDVGRAAHRARRMAGGAMRPDPSEAS